MLHAATMFYTLCYWLIAGLIVWAYRRRTGSNDALNPLFVNTIMFYGYSIGGGMFVEQGEYSFELGVLSREVIPEYYAICIIGALSYQLGFFYYACRPKPRPAGRQPARSGDSIDRFLLYTTGILAGVLFFPQVKNYLIPFVSPRYTDLVFQMLESGIDDSTANFRLYLSDRVPLTLVLAAATLTAFRASSRPLRGIGALVLIGAAVSTVIVGYRQVMMFVVAFPVVFFHYRVRRFSTRFVLAACVAVYLLFSMLQYVRYMDVDSGVKTYLELVRERPELLSPAMSSEATGPTLLLCAMIEDRQSERIGLQYFRPLVDALLTLVPRVLVDRGVGAVDEYVSRRSLTYALDFNSFGSYAMLDPYLSFGWAGVVVFMFVAGAAVSWLYSYFVEWWVGSDLHVLMYSTVFYNIAIQFSRCSLFGLPKYLLMGLAPLLVLAWLGGLLRRGSRQPSPTRRVGCAPALAVGCGGDRR